MINLYLSAAHGLAKGFAGYRQSRSFYAGRRKNRTVKSSKIEEQLKRTEARLQKTKEEKKVLQAKRKLLAEQAEIERLCSRGKILESFLKEPLKLTDGDISYLLEIMFHSSFSQKKLQELIEAKELSTSAPFGESDGAVIQEDSYEQ